MRVVGLALVALLAACAAPHIRQADTALLAAQHERERLLASQPRWSLTGRVAVSDGKDGGSGSLEWLHTPEATRFELRAPVSRQSWRLSVDETGARLDGLEGGPREARRAEALLRRELGWELPLVDLSAWVRGARGDGRARIEFGADGLPALIEQHGWRVEYRGWDHTHTPPLPTRVFAERGPHRVRLAISRWQIGS